MNSKRVISGFMIAIVLGIILLIKSNLITGIIFTVIALIAMDEYLRAISKICKPIKWVSYLSCLSVMLINYIPKEYLANALLITLPSILLILFLHVIITDMKISFKDVAYTLLGICYVPGFLIFLSLIDGMEKGKLLLLYVIIAAWITDTFAYAIGRRYGKHKFSKVSPKKSIEGCIAGTVSSVLVALLFTFLLNKFAGFEFTYIEVTILGTLLSLIGQIGDFSASVIKRYVNIKDYGTLIPGHGGILDRIDSVLFIAPFAYIIFTII